MRKKRCLSRKWLCAGLLSSALVLAVQHRAMCAEKGPVGNDSDTNNVIFGKDYLRVYVQYIHLPPVKNRDTAVVVRVKTGSQRESTGEPLKFEWAWESQRGRTYSSIGEWEVVPFIALNTKKPLVIEQEIRTRQDNSGTVDKIQSWLTLAADAFTGGAASRISRLSSYAETTSRFVSHYDQTTEKSASCTFMLFDNANGHGYQKLSDKDETGKSLPEGVWGRTWFSIFTPVGSNFQVYDPAKKVSWIMEPRELEMRRIDMKDQQDREAIRHLDWPTQYKINLGGGAGEPPDNQQGGKKSEAQWVYPSGKQPYIVLRFETYQPYPLIKQYPESVPGVSQHFRSLDDIFISSPPSSGEAGDVTKARRKLIDIEAGKLVQSLTTLVRTGDISLADAGALVEAFLSRANTFGELFVYESELLNLEKNRYAVPEPPVARDS